MEKTLKKTTHKMNTMIICKNCDSRVSGNFCSSCGQRADTHKLNMHFILHDLQHGLFHFDKGLLYTVKQLLTRPGHTIREFLEGKRVRHFQPLSIVFVLATFYGLLYHYLIFDHLHASLIERKDDITGASEKIVTWITEHFAFDGLILIITSTLVSYVIFKKRRYNLAEHLVLNTYLMGLFLIVSLLVFPIVYISGIAVTLQYGIVQQIFLLILMCWCYSQFFNNTPKVKIIGLTFVAFFITSLLNLAVGYFAGWIVAQF
jgi:hypothetical protein